MQPPSKIMAATKISARAAALEIKVADICQSSCP